MREIKDVLERINRLPPFPVVLQRALQLVGDPKSSIQEIVDVVQLDQSITASILKVCNSAYLGLRREINTLEGALVLIGFNQLIEIVLTKESAGLFSGTGSREIWAHSVTCGLLSGIASRKLNWKTAPVLFTASLLHDIGKVALCKAVNDYFGEVTKCMQEDHLSLPEAEKKLYTVEHAEIGARFAEAWSFPRPIVAAIRYHHAPLVPSEHRELVQRVYLCDIISIMAGIGGGADRLSLQAYIEVLKRYNLKKEDSDWFVTQLNDRLQFVKKVLNVTEQQEKGDDLFDLPATSAT